MARVPLKPLGHVLLGATAPKVSLEVFLDYTCPFCRKLFNRLHTDVIPYIEKTVPGQVRIHSFTHVQPWHPQGTLLAEGVLAVESLDATKVRDFIAKIYDKRDDMFVDDKIMDKTRNELYADIAGLAAEVGLDKAAVLELFKLTGTGNSGTSLTKALKYQTKYCRCRGVHVSPTVFANGLEDGSISSGWTTEQWVEYLGNFVDTSASATAGGAGGGAGAAL